MRHDRRGGGNFNPRSRGGSDAGWAYVPQGDTISIHAPAEGATQFLVAFIQKLLISIHAPAEGATA